MTNAATKVRTLFAEKGTNMTLRDIHSALPDLKASQISMALCYLSKARYLTRDLTESESKGRKKVWVYEFHPERVQKCQ